MPELQQITSPPQAMAEVAVNENFDALAHMAVYGHKVATSSGLTWGYFGGAWGGFSITASTLALTASATNYIVASRSTGALSVSTSSTNWNNTTDYARVYQVVAGASAVTTITDGRLGPAGALAAVGGGAGSTTQCLAIACSDETTALSAGTAKVTFINPFPNVFTVTGVVASLSTAQTSGSIFTVDINEAGVSILSTKLTIDNTEKNSSTAATPAVVSDASIAAYGEITIDIDQVGDGTAKGLKVYIIGAV